MPRGKKAAVAATWGANDRAGMIRDACARLAALNAERRAVGEKIAELKNEVIKGKLGFKIADFNVAFRLYELEHENRDTAVDTLRECFAALGVGDQLDWVSAVAPVVAADESPADGLDNDVPVSDGGDSLAVGGSTSSRPAAEDLPPALPPADDDADGAGHVFSAGRSAGLDGLTGDACPYPADSVKGRAWEAGRRKGARERSRGQEREVANA